MFSFNQVIRLVLQRGIVLTDNRRLPLHRRFPISALGQPADLRDGADVGAEIFRLKNGGVPGPGTLPRNPVHVQGTDRPRA